MNTLKRILVLFGAAASAALIAGALYLMTPAPARFDRAAAVAAAMAYDARIIRDKWGVPHIYGERDADVAFGLAYAHAEDDWKTFEEVLLFSRGRLAQRNGRAGAVTDYLVAALGANEAIARKYETDLSRRTRDLLSGYAAGLNLYCAEKKKRCAASVLPVTPQDVVSGFASRTPFFYGLEDELKKIFEDDAERAAGLDWLKTAFLRIDDGVELGSNAMAVSPARSSDGATRLMVNSHQPFTGPVAWYEARVKSNEGWDMIGGVFPGSPVILHGVGPDQGWAFTVNKPDLVDVYALEVDDPDRPTKYRYAGGWREFEIGQAKFRVKLWGPFSLPVSRATYRTVHGPAFRTPKGWRAVAFAGDGEIRAVEQWRRMNKAKNFEEWVRAMTMQAIPSFNVVFADRAGAIAYFYNMAAPVRAGAWDWSTIAPGDRADLVWRGVQPFAVNPRVVNPASGYVVNANNEPWNASAPADSPRAEDFPDHLGVRAHSTNRGLREQELYGADASISAEEFVAYKFDDAYAQGSNLRKLIAATLADPAITGDAALAPALDVLRAWNGSARRDSRGAALAISFGRNALGLLLDGVGAQTPDPKAALEKAAGDLIAGFGRLDPEWGAVNRLVRGDLDLPVDGGPDTLRAIYSLSDYSKGAGEAIAGDTYIMLAEWTPDGMRRLRTVHQFGAATLDASSPHYADQARLFAAERWKTPAMDLRMLEAQATRDYRPGRD
ncbi:MAG: penicillin acylase family protein [Parvularculaceae bacterium]|nr:penicillin acylase family protein [Parvularculaceae bacterium]